MNKGFRFLPAGPAWRHAWREALDFARTQEDGDVLVTGTRVGAGGEAWIRERLFEKNPLLLGQKILPWRDFVKGLARAEAVARGEGFREFNEASRRAYLRKLLSQLSESKVFHHLQDLWPEEKFFSSLLRTVGELRLAGLARAPELERAQAALRSGDSVYRETYEDLWRLLFAWDRLLPTLGQSRHDEASLLSLAAESREAPRRIFLLGFGEAALLEVELLQALARRSELILAVDATGERMEAVKKGGDPGDAPGLLLLRALLTGWGGAVEFLPSVASDPAQKPVPLLLAHTPVMEARAAGALLRVAREEGGPGRWRVILPRGLWASPQTEEAFLEQLGSAFSPSRRSALETGPGRWILQALRIGPSGHSLDAVSDFARLLGLTRSKKFSAIPTLAMKAGIRRGAREWEEKLGGGELGSEFLALLTRVTKVFPLNAAPAEYEEAFRRFVEICGIARFAWDVPDASREREAHAVLASFLRNAAMLAASSDLRMEFSAWVREMELLLGLGRVDGEGDAPEWLSFHEPGEWLPPDDSATLFLGMNSGVEPALDFTFYLEEEARRRLQGWLLRSRSGDEESFHRWCRELLASEGRLFFSRATHNLRGGEERAAWVLDALPVFPAPWPDVPLPAPQDPCRPTEDFHPGPKEGMKYSATLVSGARQCLFKAWVNLVMKVKDGSAAPELDVPAPSEGMLLHHSLRIFYETKNGRSLRDLPARRKALEESVREAASGLRLDYYMGSPQLLELQVQGMFRRLSHFVENDLARLEEFPALSETLCERAVEGSLAPGLPYEGRVDRVDRDPRRQRFVIHDYKMGSTPSTREVKELKDLQLFFYLDAWEAADPGWSAAGATYINLRSLERNQGLVEKEENENYFGFSGRTGALVPTEEFRRLRAAAREEILRLSREIQSGNFPVKPIDPDDCASCGVRAACRIREMAMPPPSPQTGWAAAREEILGILNTSSSKVPEKRPPPSFSPEQSAALSREEGFVFVEASAGTGKTTVIVERFLLALRRISTSHELEPALAVERIRAISFTEMSARELQERVSRAILPEFGAAAAARAVGHITTIHGFCRAVLQEFPLEAGVHPSFTVLDEIQSAEVKRRVIEAFFLEPTEEESALIRAVMEEFSRPAAEKAILDWLARRPLLEADVDLLLAGGRDGFLLPTAAADVALAMDFLKIFQLIAARYDAAKAEIPAVDFNDLERLTLRALRNGKVRDRWRSRVELLLVDEFQDTNALQREIVDLVARPGHANLFVVGDAKQSIYRFRAADVSVFQGLKTEAEKAGCLFPLSVNFRSQGHVVGWANHVSARIFPKNGEPKEDFEADFQHSGAHHAAGAPVKLVGYSNEEKLDARSEIEPDLLVSVIRDRRASGVALHEIAVIFRRLRGNEAYFSALNRAGIPFVLGASMGFWTSPLVVDSVALLRALYNDRNDLALLSVLRSPWMRWSAERIRPVLECGGEPPGVLDRLRAERKNSTPSRILRLAFREHPGRSSTRERLLMEMLVDVTEELESSGLAFGAVVETLSRSVAWDASESDAEKGGEMPEPSEDGAVKILTVHASKGLEFPVVILPDLDGKPRTDQSAVRFHPGQGIAVKTDTHRREDRDDPPYKEIQQRAAARDAAERARLFYVAVTRAKSELWLLVGHKEAKGEAKPAPRWQGTWGDWVRSVGAGTHAEWVDPPGAVAASLSAERPREEPPPLPPLAPSVPRSVSITELAAFRFCGEFHRRKFVMAWDDRVVDAWPKPENHRLRQAPRNGDADLVLLRKLGLERKDRGIALHRVLERVRDGFHAEEAATWLRDAYENQGACDLGARLQELIRIDLGVLRKFLESETGRKLFSGARAWPEVPFVWKAGGVEVHGAIDRLVELEPGHWVVADYKSSVNDGNLDRYAFQVNTYREAIRAWLGSSAKVDGWLVDLFTAEVHRVGESDEFTETVKGAIANYTLPREEHDPVRRGVAGGEKCFACPYALHCAPGRESVLKS